MVLTETKRGLHWQGFWSGDVKSFLQDAGMHAENINALTAELVAQLLPLHVLPIKTTGILVFILTVKQPPALLLANLQRTAGMIL